MFWYRRLVSISSSTKISQRTIAIYRHRCRQYETLDVLLSFESIVDRAFVDDIGSYKKKNS